MTSPMTPPTPVAMALSPELRLRLDGHLDAVERALAEAGSTRERRRGIVDDLEAQILDMLAGRSANPSDADLDAVLASLDPPAAYGEAGVVGAAAATGAGVAGAAAASAKTDANTYKGPTWEQLQAGAAVGTGATAGVPAKARYSRTAIWGLVCILGSFAAAAGDAVGGAVHGAAGGDTKSGERVAGRR